MRSRLLLIVVTLFAVSLAAAAIYTWVDEQGVTHFSQSPPAQGAKTLDLPEPVGGDPARDSQQRLQRLLEDQAVRDRERAAAKAKRQRQQAAERYRLWDATLSCAAARRAHAKFSTARPAFRLNRRCERVYVTDADRQRVLGALDRLIGAVCAPGFRGSGDADVDSALAQIQTVDRGYLERHGEPVEYPDFDDRSLTSLHDFCRCVPAFLREMADPRHRTPRSEIAAARDKAAKYCPELR